MIKIDRALIFALFTFIMSSQCFGSHEKRDLESENSSNFHAFHTIKKNIEQARREANTGLTTKCYHEFQQLSYSESEWKELFEETSPYKWPAQTSLKQTIGGQLFCPGKEIFQFLESKYTAHLAQRRDLFWSSVYASTFEHPLAKYFVGYILDKSITNYSDKKPPFIHKLYASALSDLEKAQDNPETLYLLGLAYAHALNVSGAPINSDQAFNFHKKCRELSAQENPQNEFRILKLRDKNLVGQTTPTKEDFLALARKTSYGPAYIEASRRTDNREEKFEILHEAIPHYPLAFVSLAYVHLTQYEEQYDPASYKAFVDMAEKSIQAGYLTLMPKLLENEKENMPLSQKIQKAQEYIQTAEKRLIDYEAYEYLADLYKKDLSNGNKKLFLESLVKGIRLGSAKCYHLLDRYSPPVFLDVVQKFGRPIQEKLYLDIENILQKNVNK